MIYTSVTITAKAQAAYLVKYPNLKLKSASAAPAKKVLGEKRGVNEAGLGAGEKERTEPAAKKAKA